MTKSEFQEKVRGGGTVPLTREEWESVAHHFPEVERHNTQLAGALLLVEMEGVMVAVEEPSRDSRVARLLGTKDEADAFVTRRLEEYERMWDGCGVKIEYFEEP